MTIRAIGYVRVSTDEQAASGLGLGLDAQRSAIRDKAHLEGWDLVEIIGEDGGVSGRSIARPGLTRALEAVESGTAEVLIVAKLDRLSRSIVDGGQVIERARRRGWQLVALDLSLDMTGPAGEMVAGVILAASQYERRMIGVRTKAALAVKREQGVKLGRPATYGDDLVARAKTMRAVGTTLQAIADAFSADAIPTARGGTWTTSGVQRLLKRA